jgi:hypothetical protein
MVMTAGLGGTLRVGPHGCLYGFVPKTDQERAFTTDLVWPRGTTAAMGPNGKPVVVSDDGAIVAEVGHSLEGLGGRDGVARHTADITCRVHARGSLFYVQGDMPVMIGTQ